jgi:sporulation protein YlmC with PRC-barrel domain
MKKTLFQITVICAACSMLSASAWAQTGSQSENSSDSSSSQSKSWSSKSLGSTGRTSQQSVRATKLTNAQVTDSSGNRIGQIQDVLVNPSSGRIDFAIISLNSTSGSSMGTSSSSTGGTAEMSASTSTSAGGKLVPVPWSLLKTSGSSSSQYSAGSEQPSFTLNVDQSKLSSAPTINWSDLNQGNWQQRSYSYFGVSASSETSTGGAESPQGEIKGEGARKLMEPSAGSSQPQSSQ